MESVGETAILPGYAGGGGILVSEIDEEEGEVAVASGPMGTGEMERDPTLGYWDLMMLGRKETDSS